MLGWSKFYVDGLYDCLVPLHPSHSVLSSCPSNKLLNWSLGVCIGQCGEFLEYPSKYYFQERTVSHCACCLDIRVQSVVCLDRSTSSSGASSSECGLVLSLSVYSILAFPQGYPVRCLRLLPRLPVTYSVFRSVKCIRRQFLRRMWPVLFSLLSVCHCRTFLFLRNEEVLQWVRESRRWYLFFFQCIAFSQFECVNLLPSSSRCSQSVSYL